MTTTEYMSTFDYRQNTKLYGRRGFVTTKGIIQASNHPGEVAYRLKGMNRVNCIFQQANPGEYQHGKCFIEVNLPGTFSKHDYWVPVDKCYVLVGHRHLGTERHLNVEREWTAASKAVNA